MTKKQFAGAMLRVVAAIGIASGSIGAASAQSGNSMGGMQMAPGSKTAMTDKKAPAKKAAHHKTAKHHHKAAKAK